MAQCVTALAEAFCKLGGVLLCNANIGFKLFKLIFGRKMQFIVFMMRAFRAHFSPLKCSKAIFRKKGQNPGYI